MTADALSAPLERLDRILARAVDRLAAQRGDVPRSDPFQGLYISADDAANWSRSPRWSPLLGVAGEQPPLVELVEPGSALALLARTHRLSSFDLELLLMALAPEVDLRYERIYAFLQDDVTRRRLGVDLALTLLCPTSAAKLARREHLASDAPLLRGELIELVTESGSADASLLARSIRLDDTVARRLLGLGGLDPRLRGVATLTDASDVPDPAGDHALTSFAAEAQARGEPLRLYFSGVSTRSKRETALALAAAAGVPLLSLDLLRASDGQGELDQLVGVTLREAALHGAVLYAEPLDVLWEPEPSRALRALLQALGGHRGIVVLGGTRAEPPHGEGLEGLLEVPFDMPGPLERRARWRAELDGAGVEVDGAELDQLADRFRLTSDEIADAVAVARNSARMAGRELATGDLFAAARTRSAVVPEGLARRIEPIHEWADLVLPADTVAQLREMRQQIIERHRVLHEWGFGRRHSRGTGVSALFAGPSGTGKTTAAEIIAGELGLDLLKIDLSGVVSKYIGETEKNLQRIFTVAENANAILFFDEAEALFGKRSEVRDSHDRYANIEIAYLLERMERYEGIAILATNMRQNMDVAFVRRLRFVIEFPFPSEQERERIWELQFPDEAQMDGDVDFAALARQFRIAGGSIRNIALGAAFLAAAERRPIGMPALLHATRREYQKLGRVLGAAELGPYAEPVAS